MPFVSRFDNINKKTLTIMSIKKLSLNDFEAVPVHELLEDKGGAEIMHMPNDDGPGGGIIDNCPKCDSRRCNGAAHSSFSEAWGAFMDTIGGALGFGNSYRGAAATGSYYGEVADQWHNYIYGNSPRGGRYPKQGATPQDIWATAYGAGNCPE